MTTSQFAPPGWHSDPGGGAFLRFWDGQSWTNHTRPFESAPTPTHGFGAARQAPVTPLGSSAVAVSSHPHGLVPSVAAPQAASAAPIGIWRGPIDDRPVVTNPIEGLTAWMRKFAQFDGRAGRPEFWWGYLGLALSWFVVFFVALLSSIVPIVGMLVLVVVLLGAAALMIPVLAAMVRRLRDAGAHWAWIFISFVPFGGIVLLVMLAQPSKFP